MRIADLFFFFRPAFYIVKSLIFYTKHYIFGICSEASRDLVHENMALRILLMILASFCLGEYRLVFVLVYIPEPVYCQRNRNEKRPSTYTR